MNRNCFGLALLLVFALAACSPDAVVSPLRVPPGPKLAVLANASGNYLVLLKGNGIPKDFVQTVSELGGKVTFAHAGLGFATVSGLSAAAAAKLGNSSRVGEIQEDAQFALDTPIETIDAEAPQLLSDPSIESQGNPAGAVLASWQWNMSLIRATAAWAAGPNQHLGSSTVKVAILDTGIDYDNRDFFRAASATLPEARLVDTLSSASFVPSDEPIRIAVSPNRNPIVDLNGHGTNVAAQVSSLAFAFGGVTSKTTLMAVKVLGATGSGSLGDVLAGLIYAADHGADVANMSLGAEFPKAGNGRLVGFTNKVLNYAKQKGMLIVVSAGNAHDGLPPMDIQHNGNTYVSYCDAPHVVCVAAVGPVEVGGFGDIPAIYSYYGKSKIDVAAPGGNAGSTVTAWPWGPGNASYVWSFCARQRVKFDVNGVPSLFGCQGGGTVSGFQGTSQASPHVAGLAALLIEKYGRGQPQMIKQLIEQSSVLLDAQYDGSYGKGRIDVKNALGI